MPFYEFGPNDIFHNQIKANPDISIIIYDQKSYYNNRTRDGGAFVGNVGNETVGSVDLLENNIDRPAAGFIYPFLTKDGTLNTFKTISLDNFSQFAYGSTLTSSYPLTASISSERYLIGQTRPRIQSLRTALNSYSKYSQQFMVSSSFGDKTQQELRLISIPSIFYGSSIDRGSVTLSFYVTGTLAAQLVDDRRNGELKQRLPQDSNSGSTAGLVLYDHGFMILTGSWNIHSGNAEVYDIYAPGTPKLPRWLDFATTGSTTPADGTNVPSSSFGLIFSGIQYVPVLTMFAHAPKGELNFSNNPTYLSYGQSGIITPLSSTVQYTEHSDIAIRNIVKSNFVEPTASFQKQTYISRIGIYDKNKNLIAIAKLATPIRKREVDGFTFKLKLDF